MENEIKKIIFETSKQKIIYVFRINDEAHEGLLKIGDTTNGYVSFAENEDNTEEMIKQAKGRIDSYTKTAGIKYELLYTTVAINNENEAFRDYDVHRVLVNSGIEKVEIAGAKEWFRVDLETAKKAIKATVKITPPIASMSFTLSSNQFQLQTTRIAMRIKITVAIPLFFNVNKCDET